MFNKLNAFFLVGLLAACASPNPFFDETAPDSGDTSPNNFYATDLNADLTMNSLVYNDNGTPNPADDTLVINNLPFDNSDRTGGGYTRVGTLPNGYERYENPKVGSPGERQYFAVFRRSDFAQVAAVGTGDYVDFGVGGATMQRLTTGRVPPQRIAAYTFTGDYAAVRITTLSGGANDVEYITGDATLYADILDYDVTGAVEGIIDNRRLYDRNGTFIGTLGDYVSLATAQIDFANAAINESTATSFEGTDQRSSGSWRGIFAGPNGEEIAGIVVLEGNVTSGEPADSVRETGTFIVVNNG